ncbi:MAG: class D sortase [Clostridia bacterium]|nr:class D sortase [Clostridia bacterium]
MQEKRLNRKIISRVFIGIGLLAIVSIGAIEAYHYPWLALLSNRQEESALPDPKPIVLEGMDVDSTLEVGEGSSSGGAKPYFENPDILPGEESKNAISSVYIQLGMIKIPKIDVSEYVLEGTQGELRYGVGHIESTEDIGEAGNCALAGHRNTHFRYLNKLSDGDKIIFKVEENTYIYEVYELFTVLPEETWVLDDVNNEAYVLTLITCTPYAVSSDRLIVRARLLNINGFSI